MFAKEALQLQSIEHINIVVIAVVYCNNSSSSIDIFGSTVVVVERFVLSQARFKGAATTTCDKIRKHVFVLRTSMNKLKNGWFSEISSLWPGQCLSLEVEDILHHEKSPYQDILLFKR